MNNENRCPDCGVTVGEPHDNARRQDLVDRKSNRDSDECSSHRSDAMPEVTELSRQLNAQTASEDEAKSKMKYFRVVLRAEVLVDVEVEAETEEDAKDKAFAWPPECEAVCCEVGSYWQGEELVCDESEMCWQIQNTLYVDIVSTAELKDETLQFDPDEDC